MHDQLLSAGYQATVMARGRSNQSRGRHKPPSQPARPASAVDDAAAALSDSSLDEELLDYLENVNKVSNPFLV